MNNENFKVDDRYRKNELSLIPGGSTLTLIYKDGKKCVYDKIKNVESYVNTAKKDETLVKITHLGKVIWSR